MPDVQRGAYGRRGCRQGQGGCRWRFQARARQQLPHVARGRLLQPGEFFLSLLLGFRLIRSSPRFMFAWTGVD